MRTTPVFALIVTASLAACGSDVQNTHASDYFERYEAAVTRAGGSEDAMARLDPAIRAAADVEPILQFPGRFGLARIENGNLTVVPEAEAALWADLAGRHRHLGEFVAVDPLIAHFTSSATQLMTDENWQPGIGRTVEMVRRGAARQHVDAVLIYEVGARSQKSSTFLAIADLTLIGGAILPTRSLEAEGVARALLMDVRNGYPYGTAQASTDLSALSQSWGSDGRSEKLRRQALEQVAAALVPQVEAMFGKLVASPPRPRLAGT